MTDAEQAISLEDQGRPGIDRKMTGEEINELPLRAYEGPTHLVQTVEQLEQVLPDLLTEPVLGFDTETRPSFTKGVNHPPSIIQLASPGAVYLFQLRTLTFREPLRDLLAHTGVIKAGVAVDRDVIDLQALSPFTPGGFVDLGEMARKLGYKNHGLRGLAGTFLGFRVSKQAQRSNWGRKHLQQKQITYAATDAWVSLELYREFKSRGLV